MESRILIPILFFLFITVLGTVMNVYLRQEQSKIVPKNIYDEKTRSALENATALIKQGELSKAQSLLKPLIAADHHNLQAWLWFAETCPTNEQQIKVLEICLDSNPNSEQVKQALDNLRSRAQLLEQPSAIAKEETIPARLGQGNLFRYLLLAGLSIVSGLLIASISLLVLSMNFWSAIVALTAPLLFLCVDRWQLKKPLKRYFFPAIIVQALSIISGLSVVGIILIGSLLTNVDVSSWEIGGLIIIPPLFLFVLLISYTPQLLIIPAISAVYKIAYLLSGNPAFYDSRPFSFVIPLVFNILGAASLRILLSLGFSIPWHLL